MVEARKQVVQDAAALGGQYLRPHLSSANPVMTEWVKSMQEVLSDMAKDLQPQVDQMSARVREWSQHIAGSKAISGATVIKTPDTKGKTPTLDSSTETGKINPPSSPPTPHS